MSKVVCINDKDFPAEVPNHKKLKKGEIYTIVKVVKHIFQGGILGYELEEISLEGCEPYLYYAASRFSIPVPEKEIEEMEELVA